MLLTARAIRLEGLEGTPSPDVSLAYAAGELLSVRRFVVLGTQRPGVRAAHIGPLRWPRHSPAPRAPGLCFYSFMEYCFSLKLSFSSAWVLMRFDSGPLFCLCFLGLGCRVPSTGQVGRAGPAGDRSRRAQGACSRQPCARGLWYRETSQISSLARNASMRGASSRVLHFELRAEIGCRRRIRGLNVMNYSVFVLQEYTGFVVKYCQNMLK